ncbi:MAG: SCO family protein [Chloroflexota bacterium]
MNTKIFFTGLLFFLIIITVYVYSLPPVFHGSVIDPPKQMPGFVLQSKIGPVNLTDQGSQVKVIFFGFTHCMDICPATMAKLQIAMDKLGGNASRIQVIFISVDYKRDTPEISSSYAEKFRPDFIGLTGSQQEIDQVTRDYGIYYKLDDPDAQGDYEVEHTASMMVLDSQDRLVLTWSPDQQPDEIAEDLKNLIR